MRETAVAAPQGMPKNELSRRPVRSDSHGFIVPFSSPTSPGAACGAGSAYDHNHALRRMILHFSHIGLTDALTSSDVLPYLKRYVIRPRVRS